MDIYERGDRIVIRLLPAVQRKQLPFSSIESFSCLRILTSVRGTQKFV